MENTINVQMSKEFYDEIMANVPQEGGGTTMTYYGQEAISSFDELGESLLLMVDLMKCTDEEGLCVILHPVIAMEMGVFKPPMEGMAIDWDKEVVFQGVKYTALKLLDTFTDGKASTLIATVPTITKEEFYKIPKIVDLTDATQEEWAVVYEDLYSQISAKYADREEFDDSLSTYGYAKIIDGSRAFTRVGVYYMLADLNCEIIGLMKNEGDSPWSGWGLRKELVDGGYQYSFNYPG